jgi:hypothetical protein
MKPEMTYDTSMSFLSRECRLGDHRNCAAEWFGLGFKVVCDCKCSHSKEPGATVGASRLGG